MKSSHSALAVVGLALAGLWYAGGGATSPAQSAAAAETPRVSAPVSHDNLAIYFIQGPDAVADTHKVVTLQEALERGWVVVNETGDVNTLTVENRSTEYELFIQEGDMIKGGKQDRVIASDMLVPPKSGVVPFPCHCVEQGRWRGRGSEAASHFNKSDNFVSGNELRYANATGQQPAVWDNVKANQDKLSQNLKVKVNAEESESSLQLAMENKQLQEKIAEFEKSLQGAVAERSNVVGVVFVVNGQVRTAEVYGSNTLFQKAWPKLLRSAATDAVAEKSAKPTPSAPSVQEVERFLTLAGQQQEPAAASLSEIRDGTTNGAIVSNLEAAWGDLDRARSENPRGDRNDIARDQVELQRATAQVGSGNRMTRALQPTPDSQDDAIRGNNDGGRVDETRVRQIAEQWSNPPLRSRAQDMEQLLRDLPPKYRPMVEEYFRALQQTERRLEEERQAEENRRRALHNRGNIPVAGQPVPFHNPQPVQAGEGRNPANPALATPVNPDGNRLTINRAEDRTGLVSEARDPSRQNAVIHKSIIKITGGLTPKNAPGGVMRAW